MTHFLEVLLQGNALGVAVEVLIFNSDSYSSGIAVTAAGLVDAAIGDDEFIAGATGIDGIIFEGATNFVEIIGAIFDGFAEAVPRDVIAQTAIAVKTGFS